MPSNLNYRPLTKPKAAPPRGSQENLSAPLVRRAGRALFVFACGWIFVCVFCSLGGQKYARRLPSWRKTASTSARPSGTSWCDPFSLAGFVSTLEGTGSPDGLLAPLGVWATYDSSCPSTQHLPALLASLEKSPYRPYMSAEHLRQSLRGNALHPIVANRTVLLVGDMVDRSLVESFCSLTGGKFEAVNRDHAWGKLALTSVPSGVSKGTDSPSYQMAHYCYVPEYDFLLTSVYHYGTDEEATWTSLPIYHSPALFEDRVQHLYKKYLESAANPVAASASLPSPRKSATPDLIFYHSSFWDLARWAKADIDAGRSAVSDLTEARLLDWRKRNVDMLHSLAQTFGADVPIVWRSTHYPTDNAGATVEWFTGQEDPHAGAGVGIAPPSADEEAAKKKANGTADGAGAAGTTPHKFHPLFHLNRIQQLNHAQISTLMPSGDDTVRGKRFRSATLPDNVQFAPWGQMMMGQDHHQTDVITPSAVPGGTLFAEMLLWNLQVSFSDV